jgi:hypothetical protein
MAEPAALKLVAGGEAEGPELVEGVSAEPPVSASRSGALRAGAQEIWKSALQLPKVALLVLDQAAFEHGHVFLLERG